MKIFLEMGVDRHGLVARVKIQMLTVIVQPRFKVVLGFHRGWGSYAFSVYDEVETLIQDLLNLFYFLRVSIYSPISAVTLL